LSKFDDSLAAVPSAELAKEAIIFPICLTDKVAGTIDVTIRVDNNKAKPSSRIEDLFKDSPSLIQLNVEWVILFNRAGNMFNLGTDVELAGIIV
ncbi:hypothetical protein Tco_1418838, partial [Tanacetum coccineum]